MAASNDELLQRLRSTHESLDTEWKPWLDPTIDIGKATIAKGCIALRNNNGGFLILGIDNNGRCVNDDVPPDIQVRYHSDNIQEILSKNSTEAFEIRVHFVPLEGHSRVMIEVPSGVKTPVFSKHNLPKNDTEKNKAGDLMKANIAYVRTLESNGRVSTAQAGSTDWPKLIKNCFDNREADIGAFVRRQLSGIDSESLLIALQSVLAKVTEPTPKDRLIPYLDSMYLRFVAARDSHVPKAPETGTREVAAIILGEFSKPELSEQYMYRFLQIPRHTGWPPFADLTGGYSLGHRKFVDKGWESFEFVNQTFNFMDFSRMEALGQFYYVEAFADDMHSGSTPMTTLEFLEETNRVAETVAICLAFAKEYCGEDSKNNLAFAFRWRKLKGRQLCSWIDPRKGNRAYGTVAEQNEIVEYATIPVATSVSAIGQYVEAVVRPLFHLFGGWEFQSSVIQDIVTERLRGS